MTDGRDSGVGAVEREKNLDVMANDIFCDVLRASGRTGVIASAEEDATPVAVEETYGGNYVVVFDPLDGSSNVDAAVSTGSIFGVYEGDEQCVPDFDADAAAVVVGRPFVRLTGAGPVPARIASPKSSAVTPAVESAAWFQPLNLRSF